MKTTRGLPNAQPWVHVRVPRRTEAWSRQEFLARLRRRAGREQLSLPPQLELGLWQYYSVLRRWNVKLNLTSLGESDAAIDRLLIEPLLAGQHLRAEARTAMDLGSGGGSPAIPLKLACPHLHLWMVESKMRKAAFLREVARQLGLVDTTVETQRVESLLVRPDLHEAMDLVTVRAIRLGPAVLRAIQAFVRPGGEMWWFRSCTLPEPPLDVRLPFQLVGTHKLVGASRSELAVLSKAGG